MRIAIGSGMTPLHFHTGTGVSPPRPLNVAISPAILIDAFDQVPSARCASPPAGRNSAAASRPSAVPARSSFIPYEISDTALRQVATMPFAQLSLEAWPRSSLLRCRKATDGVLALARMVRTRPMNNLDLIRNAQLGPTLPSVRVVARYRLVIDLLQLALPFVFHARGAPCRIIRRWT